MSSTFRPPTLDRLTEVEIADCVYQEGLVEIEGVVSPRGQGGRPHSDEYEVRVFCFSVWRRVGQPLVEKELAVLRPADPKEEWYSEFPKLSIHRIQVLLSTDETRAIFAARSGNAADTSGLVEVAEELAKPVVVKSKRFGDLTLDRSIGWFEGNAQWNGQRIRVIFHTDENQDFARGIEAAEELWNDDRLWAVKVNNYAVQELLPLKNGNWLGDDESPLSADEFKSRMILQSISIHPDGTFEFWHDDGDLFWGHSIQVTGSLSGGLSSAGIHG